MELISESKRKNCTSKYNRGTGLSIMSETYWNLGVNFAENELQNLAIEYSEWLSAQKDYSFCKNKNVWTLYGKSREFDLTSKQLFDKFIEQRNKA